jgi:hypothetical protein
MAHVKNDCEEKPIKKLKKYVLDACLSSASWCCCFFKNQNTKNKQKNQI